MASRGTLSKTPLQSTNNAWLNLVLHFTTLHTCQELLCICVHARAPPLTARTGAKGQAGPQPKHGPRAEPARRLSTHPRAARDGEDENLSLDDDDDGGGGDDDDDDEEEEEEEEEEDCHV